MDRNSAWANYVVQNDTRLFDSVFYNPPQSDRYVFQNERPKGKPKGIKIYEAHVGMSSEGGRVA